MRDLWVRIAGSAEGLTLNDLDAESPFAREVSPEWRDKVWFARLRAGGLDVTGGDILPRDYEAPRGFSLVLGVANADEADRVFAGVKRDPWK